MIDHDHNKSAWSRTWTKVKKCLDPPPKLLPSEWADRYRVLSKEANAKGGKFKCMPFQREPMDSVIDPDVISTTLMWASQVTGKTEVTNCLVGYFMHQDPSPMLLIQPTLDMGKAWSKDRLATMIRDTPVLTELVNPARARDSGNTVLHKSFPGGHITIGGANSPAGLASRPIRGVFADEKDRFALSAGTEGDPHALALVRTMSFHNAFSLETSTPTIKGLSAIEEKYETTDKRHWMVTCPDCGYEWTLGWANVKWAKDRPETAQIQCPGCGKLHEDKTRVEMVMGGYWQATAEFNGHRGYWLNGLNCLFPAQKGYKNRLHQAAATFLDAKHKGKEKLQVFVNTFLAESWEDESEQIPADNIIRRREDYAIDALPDKICLVTAGVDVQDDRLEAEAVGWGAGEESWGVEYMQFVGDPAKPQVWNALDTWMQSTYNRKDGVELTISATCIDTGGHHTKSAYNFIKPRQSKRVYGIKGASRPGMPLVSRPKKSGVEKIKLLMIGSDTGKELIYGRLGIEEGAGYCHVPSRYSEEWCQQLVAERIVTEFKQGQAHKKFVKPSGARNEALDIRVYATAAMSLLGYNLEKLTEIMKDKISSAQMESPKPKSKKTRTPRSNWVTSW